MIGVNKPLHRSNFGRTSDTERMIHPGRTVPCIQAEPFRRSRPGGFMHRGPTGRHSDCRGDIRFPSSPLMLRGCGSGIQNAGFDLPTGRGIFGACETDRPERIRAWHKWRLRNAWSAVIHITGYGNLRES